MEKNRSASSGPLRWRIRWRCRSGGIDPQTGRNSYLYVGGGFGDIKQSPSSKAINKYLSNKTIRYKKILVVADSLRKVMEKIEPRLRDWYIMVDEIDSYQSDSTYRNRALGWVMDYFFKFPERGYVYLPPVCG